MPISTIPTSGLSSDQGVNFRNLIINGDMSVAQRATSATSLTGSGYNTCDRWRLRNASLGTWTQSQSTDVPSGQGFAKSLKMDCTTADASPSASDDLRIDARLEGQNLQMLKKGTSNAESLTLSFWVKSNKTGTYTVALTDKDNSRQISQAYTISSSNTWEKKILTYVADTTGTLGNDNNNSFETNFVLACGTNFSSGTLQTSWGSTVDANRSVGQVNLADSTSNEWYITGVQLEVGTTASDFEFIPFDVNLQRCKRYYESFGTFGDYLIGYGYGSGSDTARTSFPFTVEKRVTPTMADVSSSRQVRINWTSSDGTAVNQNSTTQATFSEPNIKNSGYVQIGGYSSIGGGQHGYCRMNNATTTYEADAEL